MFFSEFFSDLPPADIELLHKDLLRYLAGESVASRDNLVRIQQYLSKIREAEDNLQDFTDRAIQFENDL